MEIQNTDSFTELQIGNIRFQVIPHFRESGKETIDTKLVKLMESEQSNHLIKPDSS